MTRRYLSFATVFAIAIAIAVATFSERAFAAAPVTKPVLEKLQYAPIGDFGTEDNPQAHFTLTMDLPDRKIGNVSLYVTQPQGDDVSILLPGTATGVRHVEVKSDALSPGRYHLFLADRIYGVGAPTLISKSITVTVDAKGEAKVG